ncbi:DUF2510 domain-containing protein [Kitasatospora sp. NPDC002040]|uniref:DUF2510 domain-containing protein n=1 Tax=Kitasatospora sp. NPDC002040 TaxID=3154661 RepID=UPI00332B23DE
MTYSTPPGWYPVLDPGPDGRAQERWWDGQAWTAELRPVPAPVSAPKRGAKVGLVIGLALVVLAGGTGVLLWATRDADPAGRPAAAPPAVTGSPSGTSSASPSTTPSASPTASPTPAPVPSLTPVVPSRPPLPSTRSVQDLPDGWEVPVPSGWRIDDHTDTVTLQFSTTPYSCNVGSGNCVRANFAVAAERFEGASAQAVVRERMSVYGPTLYGDLTGTRTVTAGPVMVAGRLGHAERWRLDPVKGVPGYVLVVAVRSPQGGYTVLVGSTDEHPDAPGPELLDQLVDSIRPISGTGTGAGTGSAA